MTRRWRCIECGEYMHPDDQEMHGRGKCVAHSPDVPYIGPKTFKVREYHMADREAALYPVPEDWIHTDNDMRIFLTLMQKGYIREIGWMKFYLCHPYPWAKR